MSSSTTSSAAAATSTTPSSATGAQHSSNILNPVTNILFVMVLFAPIFVVLMVLGLSVFAYQNANGLIYLIILVSFCAFREFVFVQGIYSYYMVEDDRKKKDKIEWSNWANPGLERLAKINDDKSNVFCNLVSFSRYKNSSFSTFVFSFTLGYMIYPMIYTSNYNGYTIAFILFFLLIDLAMRINQNCYTKISDYILVLIDIISGGLAAVVSCVFFFSIKQPQLLFYSASSNLETCALSNQVFQCKVTQGGQTLASTFTT